MTRHLQDRATGAIVPYPRQDDLPVVGLDHVAYHVLQEVREPQPTATATQQISPADPVIVITDPDGTDLNGTISYGWTITTIAPPAPSPDWIAFELALNKEPAIINLLNDLGRASQIGALSLGHALEEAEHGNIDRFLPVWRELIIASAPPPATLERFRDLAAAHNLPADFQAAIAAAPVGPPVAP
jgi:hypothetical protein